jgi:hypothetical protein
MPTKAPIPQPFLLRILALMLQHHAGLHCRARSHQTRHLTRGSIVPIPAMQMMNQALTTHLSMASIHLSRPEGAQIRLSGDRCLSSQLLPSLDSSCPHITIQLGLMPNGRRHSLIQSRRRGPRNFLVHGIHGMALRSHLQIGPSTKTHRQ